MKSTAAWRLGAVTVAATLACAAALAQKDNATAPTTAAPARANMAASGAMGKIADSSGLTHADVAFMKQAAEAGAVEIEASQMAATKAGSEKVKAFAQQMVTDHTKAAEELSALAASKHVTLPSGPSITQKAKEKLLSARSGAGFDRSYASTIGVSAHEDAVKLFQKAATTAKDPDVKAFAQKTLPGLTHHLEMARKLAAGDAKAAMADTGH
jgi:putative membrane protein